MTTNQTIDGVPRELLEFLADAGSYVPRRAELRALLDAPADVFVDPTKSCDLCGHECNATQSRGATSELVAFGIQVEKLLCDALGREWSASCISIESLVAELRGKPQGEPVAYQFQDRDGKWCGFMNERHYQSTVSDGTWPIRALYAEQPATVAVVRLGVNHVLGAIHNIEGFPGVTGYQIKTLTDLLNSAITGK